MRQEARVSQQMTVEDETNKGEAMMKTDGVKQRVTQRQEREE